MNNVDKILYLLYHLWIFGYSLLLLIIVHLFDILAVSRRVLLTLQLI